MTNSKNNIIRKNILGTSVFKKEETLLLDYIPPHLPCRDEELARLSRNYKPIIMDKGSFNVNVAMTGPAGVGKTSLARLFGNGLVEAAKNYKEILCFYFNCYSFRTKSSILREITGKHFGISSRGLSDNELLTQIFNRLKNKNKHILLILDEAFILGADSILSLIHSYESYGFGYSPISMIIISRPEEYKSLLSSQLKGKITDLIELETYTEEMFREIIDYRVDLAFKPSVISEDIKELIIDIVSETKNARHMIEILYQSGKRADRKEDEDEITADMVRASKKDVYPELRNEMFTNLRTQELITALALAKRLKHRGIVSTNIKESYEYYKVSCEEFGVEKHSINTYRVYINSLTKYGIINKVTKHIGRGRRGRRSRLTLFDIPAKILEERVYEILENRKKENNL
ncbi:MAG: AAA family ATPase [Promethearchaeota archaeon]|nr:MAG: AAA family ATPase [Candidatus Lokiarchaeota archaeon]